MKITGICSDKELLDNLRIDYNKIKGNNYKSNSKVLDGKDFVLFLREAYSSDGSGYKC